MEGRGRFVGPRWLVAAGAGLAAARRLLDADAARTRAAAAADPAPASASATGTGDRAGRAGHAAADPPAPPPARRRRAAAAAADAAGRLGAARLAGGRGALPRAERRASRRRRSRPDAPPSPATTSCVRSCTASSAAAPAPSRRHEIERAADRRLAARRRRSRRWPSPGRTSPRRVAATSGAAASIGRRPAVVIVAGQHGDEPAGTEALHRRRPGAGRGPHRRASSSSVDVVLLPRANPDGAAAFSAPPPTASTSNRDHLLLQHAGSAGHRPAAARHRAAGRARPARVPGRRRLHQPSSARVQRFDVLLQYATTANLPPFVTKAAEEWFRAPLVAGLRSAGLSVDWYATVSADPADRTLSMGSVAPQVGRNASGLRNAVSLLVETRGGGIGRADFKRRVQAQLVAVDERARAARRITPTTSPSCASSSTATTTALACQGEGVLEAAPTPSEYAYADARPADRRDPPHHRRLGVGAAAARAEEPAARLRLLARAERDRGGAAAAPARHRGAAARRAPARCAARAIARPGASRSARRRGAAAGAATRLRVQTQPALLDVAAGSYYVSLEQPLAHLAIAALEPESPASYAANGVIATSAASPAS